MTDDYHIRRLQAVALAAELLAEASVDPARQVDVFGLCEQLGLWLVFRPLDRLLGAFIPEGVGGVLITTERPVTVQRYTAAHELGHWRLGHAQTHAFDGEAEVLGTTPDDESEHLAQIFAAALLMPPPLVFGTLERLRVKGDISVVDAYTVAREAGVSYEAAVRQIENLELIGRNRRVDLLAAKPLEIKTKIGWGQRPVKGSADVWPVDKDWHGHRLDVRIDDEVVIVLPENRSTGYRWVFAGHETQRPRTPEPPHLRGAESFEGSESLVRQQSVVDRIRKIGTRVASRGPVPEIAPNDLATPVVWRPNVDLGNGTALVGDRYFTPRSSVVSNHGWIHGMELALLTDSSISRLSLPNSLSVPPVIGGSGQRVLTVRFQRPGPVTLRLSYQSSYNESDPAEEYALTAYVEPRRRWFSVEQLGVVADDSFIIPVRQGQAETTTADSESFTTDPLP